MQTSLKLIPNSIVSILFLFVILLSSCEKEMDDTDVFLGENLSIADSLDGNLGCSNQNNWKFLVDAVSLGDVKPSLIKTVAKLAGYPQFNNLMNNTIHIYKLVYKTTFMGDTILASGLVSFPIDRSVSFPVMVVGNGLIFANNDAPSEFDLPKNYSGFEFIASAGYIVMLPDMIGFGESKDKLFPIHNSKYSASAMIDFIRAANEFIECNNMHTTGKTFLTGYSQGAHIALSTLKKVEENPDLEISFTAVAVGAGGYNLEYILEYSIEKNSYSAPSHLALLLSSYNLIYDWNKPLNYFFNEPYALSIPNLIAGDYTREEIDAKLSVDFDVLLNPDFLEGLRNKTEKEFFSALQENSVYNWAPKTPLKLIHSLNDDRIPYTDSENTFNAMVALGSTSVTYLPLESTDHFNSAFDFIDVVFKWFKELQ
jgi:pimeloyl-ACP methyl ester carboxylesterase